MDKAPEVIDVRLGPQGIFVTFSNGKVGGYSAALLASLYAESTAVRKRQSSQERGELPLIRKPSPILL